MGERGVNQHAVWHVQQRAAAAANRVPPPRVPIVGTGNTELPDRRGWPDTLHIVAKPCAGGNHEGCDQRCRYEHVGNDPLRVWQPYCVCSCHGAIHFVNTVGEVTACHKNASQFRRSLRSNDWLVVTCKGCQFALEVGNLPLPGNVYQQPASARL